MIYRECESHYTKLYIFVKLSLTEMYWNFYTTRKYDEII